MNFCHFFVIHHQAKGEGNLTSPDKRSHSQANRLIFVRLALFSKVYEAARWITRHAANYSSPKSPMTTSSESAARRSDCRLPKAGCNMADVLSVGVNLEAFSQAISAIQALRSSVSRVFDCLKDGMRNKETLEGREKAFIAHFQDNLHSVNRDLK